MFNVVFFIFYAVCLNIIYNFRKLVILKLILKCKTIFYATCHLSGEFFLLMWTLYGASKGPFY
ncbi:unnamed protein product [Brassica rapa]|uniref:Uncharacterized protein n=1 Tax=Brassica campestris TaxID=3711 RepID=A0A8D9GFB3_BRACM|nr:unnamed protein product [Brassica rapa]